MIHGPAIDIMTRLVRHGGGIAEHVGARRRQGLMDLVPPQRLGHRRRHVLPAAELDEAIARLPPMNVAQWKLDRAKADPSGARSWLLHVV